MEILYWLWIARMKYIYFEVFDKLVEKYKNMQNIWNLSYDELYDCHLFNEQQIKEICNPIYRKNLSALAEYMKKRRINMVTCYDSKYPAKLNFIRNKPIVLFYKGNIDIINNESVAIVGSRNCTIYGRKCADYFSYDLARRGINIISGLAIGIDSIAHISALNGHGKTIAVLRMRTRQCISKSKSRTI